MTLPDLPEREAYMHGQDWFSVDQMRDYGRLCGERGQTVERALWNLSASSEEIERIGRAATTREAVAWPTEEEVDAWADEFIRKEAYNRSAAVMIAREAAKWVGSRANRLIENLTRALAEEVNGPTFMGEPAAARPSAPADAPAIVSVPLSLWTDMCGMNHTAEQDWKREGCWTEWDQSVADRRVAFNISYMERATPPSASAIVEGAAKALLRNVVRAWTHGDDQHAFDEAIAEAHSFLASPPAAHEQSDREAG